MKKVIVMCTFFLFYVFESFTLSLSYNFTFAKCLEIFWRKQSLKHKNIYYQLKTMNMFKTLPHFLKFVFDFYKMEDQMCKLCKHNTHLSITNIN